MRYAPLAAIPFGIGCLIEFGATLFPLGNGPQQVVVVALFVCLLLSLLLFLKFPAGLRPMWIRQLDEEALEKGRATGEGGPAAR